MIQKKQLGGLDYFRIIAAFLVVAIHTSPLASFGMEADFIFTGVIARIAVPSFFMTTGYFLLPQYLFGHSMDRRPLVHSVKKHMLLYVAAIFLYLPVNLYAEQFKEVSIGSFFRMLFVDGTFYHLWYLPAAMLGMVFVWFLGSYMPFGILTGMVFVLYMIGLFGDSYYGLTVQFPFLEKMYDMLFSVSSYTRNGLFYAPVFLVMGAEAYSRTNTLTGKKCKRIKHTKHIRNESNNFPIVYAAGFVVSLALMVAEGLVLRRFHLQRHDSMYVMLLPVMFFLFQLLLSIEKTPVKSLRSISTWIYIIHPFCIVLIRGAAKVLHLESLFVENSWIHYLTVCAASGVAGVIGNRVSVHFSAFGGEKQSFAKGRAWIELSRENLVKNVEMLQNCLSPGQQLMPAVKADAYGHGANLIAGELNQMGIQNFCVACVEEGVNLRKNGITGDILILGYTYPKDFPLLRKYRLTQTVVDYAYGRMLNGYGKKMKVHVKIDTGMHRLGERAERDKEICRIFQLKNLEIEGIYTHLCADETRNPEDMAFTKEQARLFHKVTEKVQKRGYFGLKTHLLASYGLINYPELGGDYVRVGIALYGLLSDRKTDMSAFFPVLSLRARITAVKEVFQGESVGYGFTYVAEEDRKIAVLAIGYADGLPRSLSGGNGRVLIHGKSAPVLGRICMDQTIVDVTEISGVKAGGIATIIGKDGNQEITAYELAENTGTITNEILSRMGGRLFRVMV